MWLNVHFPAKQTNLKQTSGRLGIFQLTFGCAALDFLNFVGFQDYIGPGMAEADSNTVLSHVHGFLVVRPCMKHRDHSRSRGMLVLVSAHGD